METKKCPDCAEVIKREAQVCKHCGYRYTAAELAAEKKADEEAAKVMGVGCLIVLIIGIAIYLFSGSDEDEPKTAMMDEVASSTILASPEPTSVPSHEPQSSAEMAENGEIIATGLNLNGLLCARVTEVRRLTVQKNVFEVTCIEYRGGSGTVRYIYNTETGIAFRP